MKKEVKELILKMLMNGELGRTKNDYINEPEASLDLLQWNDGTFIEYLTISTYHYLTQNLELDTTCNVFNSQEVEDYNSNEFYGVSAQGEEYLMAIGKWQERNWNTYNYESHFSRILQGRCSKEIFGNRYVLLQVHNGGDVRGNYTDAKLFKISDNCEFFLSEAAIFKDMDWLGEWIDCEGNCISETQWKEIREKYKVSRGNSVRLLGQIA